MYATKWMNPKNIIVWVHLYEMSRTDKFIYTNWRLCGAEDGVRLHQMGSREFLGDDGNDLKLNYGDYCPTLQIHYKSLNFVLIIGIF